jgi:DNA-binding SARP family transcriptional activator
MVQPGGHVEASADGAKWRRHVAGLVRHRLTARLLDPAEYLVARVVAPAGCGKSRFLAHVALAYQGPVAWCGAPEPVPRTKEAFCEWLWEGLAPAIDVDELPRPGFDGIADALSGSGPSVLVVVDDVHLLEGVDAELALADLVQRQPPRMRLVMGSRVDLAVDLSRLRVSGQLVEIGADDLRFRTWEVEELFRDVYREPLIPEDAAALAQRTGGWAAYLQLFHLATHRKSQAERRRVLYNLAQRSRLVQEYLTRHVLAGLSADLQDFLIRTSVLRRPTGALCDELLGWTAGSREMLAELERRQLFTERIDDDSYRYHTVLLSYLEARLVETVGSAAASEEHRRAAVLLEREGLTEDAAAAFAKAEDWEGLARTLGHPDGAGEGMGGAWLEALPPTVVETDALLLSARARRALASGALAEAISTLRAAEAVAASSAVAERCRRERDRIATWVSPERAVGQEWLELLRSATQRQPREAQRTAAALGGAIGRFAEGAAAFVAGDMRSADRILRGVATRPDAATVLAVGARLMAAVAGPLCDRAPGEDDLEQLWDEVEDVGVPWLDRMVRVVVATANGGPADVLDSVSEACRREDDRWGEALVGLLGGWRMLRGPFGSGQGQMAVRWFERAVTVFESIGAGVLEATARGYLALSAHAVGDTDLATRAAHQTRTLASLLDVPGPGGVAALALWRLLGDERELTRAKEVLEPLGTWDWHQGLGSDSPHAVGDAHGFRPSTDEPTAAGPVAPGSNAAGPKREGARWDGSAVGSEATRAYHSSNGGLAAGAVRLRCLGGFSLVLGRYTLDESVAKPMERALLHLLAMRAGEPVHREALMEALWPDADRHAGRHRLQVAISSLRRLLSSSPDPATRLLARDGESYRLALPEGSDVDVWQLEASLRRAAGARSAGEPATEKDALAAALASYGGPLLPGDGPAEWVVDRRALLQNATADAAGRLANLHLDSGDYQAASEAARAGLAMDRYRDDLWKLVITAADRSGHHAEAGQARRAYAAVLEELGV